MRVLLEEVVLDLPDVLEAEPIGELRLGQRVLEQLELGPFVPRARELMLVEDPEAHGVLLGDSLAAYGRAARMESRLRGRGG